MRNSTDPGVSCDNVQFEYKRGRPVLQGATLTVNRGDIYGLLGPNGAGKSTLMKVILGLDAAQGGTIEWFGEPLSAKTKKLIGYVPQDLAMLFDMSALDNVLFFGRLYGLRGSQLAANAQEALEFVELWKDRKRKPSTYSGGMKRRLNIACGIVHKPRIVIMDEPTVGVDPQSRNAIMESIRRMSAFGSTVIYISHYMEEVSQLCNRIGVMDAGKVLAEGTLEEILAQYAPEAVVELRLADGAHTVPNLAGFTVISQTAESISISIREGDVDSLANLAEAASVTGSGFSYMAPSLEQAFFRLTQKKLRD